MAGYTATSKAPNQMKIQYSLKSIFFATVLIGGVLFSISFIYRSEPPIPVRPSAKKCGPIVSIFSHFITGDDPFVEFAIWRDGAMIWRKTPSDPTSPLLSKKVKSSVIDELFRELSSARLLDPEIETFHVGTSSDYISIEVATEEGVVELASWHEQFSQLPLVVCTDFGVEGIEPGKNKEDYVAKWSREYKLFRKNWSIIRDLSNELRDSSGKPFTGVIPTPTEYSLKNKHKNKKSSKAGS